MAAPQRRYRAPAPARPYVQPVERKRTGGATVRRKAAGRRQRFAAIVVVPVLLMLGSVYLHTVSAGLTGRVAYLEEQLAQTRGEGERLEVRVAELSRANRIRTFAVEKLGMQDPRGADLKVYDGDGEDGVHDGGEEKGGKLR